MSKHCPNCGYSNGDDRIFCAACGDPLGGDLELIMDLERDIKKHSDPRAQRASRYDDDDYVVRKVTPAKKESHFPWALVLLAVAAAAVLWFLLK